MHAQRVGNFHVFDDFQHFRPGRSCQRGVGSAKGGNDAGRFIRAAAPDGHAVQRGRKPGSHVLAQKLLDIRAALHDERTRHFRQRTGVLRRKCHAAVRHVAGIQAGIIGNPPRCNAGTVFRDRHIATQAGQHAHAKATRQQAITQRSNVLVRAVVSRDDRAGVGGRVDTLLNRAQRHEYALRLAAVASLHFSVVLGFRTVQAAALHSGLQHAKQ